MSEPTPKTLKEIAAGTKYPLDAFHFVRRGLDYTVNRVHADQQPTTERQRHVTGRQLCEGVRDFAIEQYGGLARMVLARWHILRTEDFGQIVFAMVEGGLMQATEDDTIADFRDVFSFDEVYDLPVPMDRVPPAGFEADPVEQM